MDPSAGMKPKPNHRLAAAEPPSRPTTKTNHARQGGRGRRTGRLGRKGRTTKTGRALYEGKTATTTGNANKRAATSATTAAPSPPTRDTTTPTPPTRAPPPLEIATEIIIIGGGVRSPRESQAAPDAHKGGGGEWRGNKPTRRGRTKRAKRANNGWVPCFWGGAGGGRSPTHKEHRHNDGKRPPPQSPTPTRRHSKGA